MEGIQQNQQDLQKILSSIKTTGPKSPVSIVDTEGSADGIGDELWAKALQNPTTPIEIQYQAGGQTMRLTIVYDGKKILSTSSSVSQEEKSTPTAFGEIYGLKTQDTKNENSGQSTRIPVMNAKIHISSYDAQHPRIDISNGVKQTPSDILAQLLSSTEVITYKDTAGNNHSTLVKDVVQNWVNTKCQGSSTLASRILSSYAGDMQQNQ